MESAMNWKDEMTDRNQVVAISRNSHRNKRLHHKGTVIYRGIIELSDKDLESIAAAPVYRTTSRHCVLRWTDENDVVWLVRNYQPNVTLYLGEVVRTEKGAHRVHLFRPSREAYPNGDPILKGRTLYGILQWKEPQDKSLPTPIVMPPLVDLPKPVEAWEEKAFVPTGDPCPECAGSGIDQHDADLPCQYCGGRR